MPKAKPQTSRKVTASRLRWCIAECLSRAELSKERTVITRFGRPVAVIAPVEQDDEQEAA